jgi:hypothetical protein
MTTETLTRKPPPPPKPSHVLAVALELGIVAVLAAHKAWIGLALAACYAWFLGDMGRAVFFVG